MTKNPDRWASLRHEIKIDRANFVSFNTCLTSIYAIDRMIHLNFQSPHSIDLVF